uniref:Cytochrome b6/f complex subunit VI n=1 Tax=Gloeochaete wittrockiana TaxID=38269 RepID=A0A3G1IWB6_9EUKA|nr:cytochrome b6/f complex subunit VI [Gloeochaete wittrockiana]ASQ40239.1 cytochrome b6/f complex subunit VI [Gloeochaete wittrockiana]
MTIFTYYFIILISVFGFALILFNTLKTIKLI